MKKLFLLATVVVAMTFASCGNKTQPSANAEADSTEMSTDSTKVVAADIPEDVKALTSQLAEKLDANDASGIAATIEGAKAKAVEMAKNNPEKAKEYLTKLQVWLKSNAEGLKKVVANAGNSTISNALNSAVTAVSAASPDALLSGLTNAAENVKDAGEAALNNAKEGRENGAEKAEDAKEAVKSAQAKVQKNAQEKINEAKDEATKKLNDASNKAGKKANKAINDAAKEAAKGLGL